MGMLENEMRRAIEEPLIEAAKRAAGRIRAIPIEPQRMM